MNGPEHYLEAERLLAGTVNESASEDCADHYDTANGAGGYDYTYLLAAQVHATLALAAATVETGNNTGRLVHAWQNDGRIVLNGGPWGLVLHPEAS